MSNTIKRKALTRQDIEQIAIRLRAGHMDGGEAAGLVMELAQCLKGSVYAEYGSVDLGDIANTMIDEVIAFEEPSICNTCNGSGEGQYDGTNCSSCGGSGEIASLRSQRDAECNAPD